MRKSFLDSVLVMFFVLNVSLFAGAAKAITNGSLDNNNHPYVCLVFFDVETDEGIKPGWRTTGILLSDTVVLTAGHGTDGAVAARVWVDPGPIATIDDNPPGEYPYGGDDSYEGAPYTMPGFGYGLTNPGLPGWISCDVGIVRLSEPVPTSVVDKYGDLPSEGLVNTLSIGSYVDLVGYGVQYQVTPRNDGGPYGAWRGTLERYFVQAQLLSKKFAISDQFLITSANKAMGKGGTTFGDSGGPVLMEGTETVLALTSFGADANCAAPGYYYRVDQAEVLSFINGFLTADLG
jgi:hypothetical protein